MKGKRARKLKNGKENRDWKWEKERERQRQVSGKRSKISKRNWPSEEHVT